MPVGPNNVVRHERFAVRHVVLDQENGTKSVKMSWERAETKMKETHAPQGFLSDFKDFRFSCAPMMDWTDRHCRVFHRLLTRRARLYTEMLTTGAIMHGDR